MRAPVELVSAERMILHDSQGSCSILPLCWRLARVLRASEIVEVSVDCHPSQVGLAFPVSPPSGPALGL